jgi:uncharacterized protein
MEYQTGTLGRVVVARFDHGDDVLAGLAEVARRENIRVASFHLVGAIQSGRYVVGPESEELPPVPVWRQLQESHEAVGFGTIYWQGDSPRVHFHGTYGKRDQVRMGCLREETQTFLILEAVIMEILGVRALRELDPTSGMLLMQLQAIQERE